MPDFLTTRCFILPPALLSRPPHPPVCGDGLRGWAWVDGSLRVGAAPARPCRASTTSSGWVFPLPSDVALARARRVACTQQGASAGVAAATPAPCDGGRAPVTPLHARAVVVDGRVGRAFPRPLLGCVAAAGPPPYGKCAAYRVKMNCLMSQILSTPQPAATRAAQPPTHSPGGLQLWNLSTHRGCRAFRLTL